MKKQIRYLLMLIFFVLGMSFSFAKGPAELGGPPSGDPPVSDAAVSH